MCPTRTEFLSKHPDLEGKTFEELMDLVTTYFKFINKPDVNQFKEYFQQLKTMYKILMGEMRPPTNALPEEIANAAFAVSLVDPPATREPDVAILAHRVGETILSLRQGRGATFSTLTDETYRNLDGMCTELSICRLAVIVEAARHDKETRKKIKALFFKVLFILDLRRKELAEKATRKELFKAIMRLFEYFKSEIPNGTWSEGSIFLKRREITIDQLKVFNVAQPMFSSHCALAKIPGLFHIIISHMYFRQFDHLCFLLQYDTNNFNLLHDTAHMVCVDIQIDRSLSEVKITLYDPNFGKNAKIYNRISPGNDNAATKNWQSLRRQTDRLLVYPFSKFKYEYVSLLCIDPEPRKPGQFRTFHVPLIMPSAEWDSIKFNTFILRSIFFLIRETNDETPGIRVQLLTLIGSAPQVVNLYLINGLSLLLAGCLMNHKTVVEVLIRYGVDVNMRYLDFNALHFAVNKNNPQIVAKLIGAGADVNRATLDSKSTSLHLACEQGHLEIVRILVAHKKTQLNLRNKCEYLALFYAIKKGRFEIVRALLSRPDLDLTLDVKGKSALVFAHEHAQFEIARMVSREITRRRVLS